VGATSPIPDAPPTPPATLAAAGGGWRGAGGLVDARGARAMY